MYLLELLLLHIVVIPIDNDFILDDCEIQFERIHQFDVSTFLFPDQGSKDLLRLPLLRLRPGPVLRDVHDDQRMEWRCNTSNRAGGRHDLKNQHQ